MSQINSPVLVLNTGWTPIHIKSVKEAISDVFSDVAEIVEHCDFEITSEDGKISSCAYVGLGWAEWMEISRPGIPLLQSKVAELREEAKALRAEAKVMVDLVEANKLLAEAKEREDKANANDPRIIHLNRNVEVRGPEVIRLLDYNEIPDMEIRLTRKNLLLRDNYTCQYCGKRVSASTFTIDHVHPRSRDGENSWENFVVACFKCNVAKRDRTPKEAGLTLRSKPVKPKWYPLTTRFTAKTQGSWRKFLPEAALSNRPLPPDVDESEFLSKKRK